MKKIISALTAITMTATLVVPTTLVMAQDEITVTVNGQEIDFSVYDNVMPFIENDRTLIPIRAIAENMSFTVDWDGAERLVTVKNDSTDIVFVIDGAAATVNGEEISLDAPARIVDDRTFVPLRFVSENMGATVEWEEESRMITITTEQKREGTKPDGNGGGPRMGGNGFGGGGMVENSADVQAVIDANSSKFEQLTFEDKDNGITLEYSLFKPESYDSNTKYPLIMYIPDATGAGKSAKEIVEQYYGANVWVSDEDQAKHASFVLVPAFSETVTDDNWNASEQIETAVKLIKNLTEEYSIDTDRLYTTGQSMGCMTSLYLNSKYPDLFAASMFVSGQWDISVLKPLENAKFFYITAGGDAKASGGQSEVMTMLDADGVKYTYGEWDAQLGDDEQSANVEKLLADGLDANMVRFETGTVLNGGQGMEHMASFNYGYKLTAVRDWLFKQSKNNS